MALQKKKNIKKAESLKLSLAEWLTKVLNGLLSRRLRLKRKEKYQGIHNEYDTFKYKASVELVIQRANNSNNKRQKKKNNLVGD